MHDLFSNYNIPTSIFNSIEEFDILTELGKGGYSIVYLARHKETSRKYAIKCAFKIKEKKDGSLKDVSKKAYQEIRILSRLKHRHIISLKGWFEDEDTIYLVLPYISGKDLSKYFKTELPNKKETVRIIRQIIEALKYCHRRNIIHRDIKLDNILINRRLNIRLTDFGLCAIKEENEYFYDEVGTARYTAPEILLKSGYDEKIDVWGLGVILFMLLTGEYPFDGSKRQSIFRRIKEKNINYSKYEFEEEEEDLLRKLLCKNPHYRIDLEDILKTDLFIKYS